MSEMHRPGEMPLLVDVCTYLYRVLSKLCRNFRTLELCICIAMIPWGIYSRGTMRGENFAYKKI
jgi:hypothetical protein